MDTLQDFIDFVVIVTLVLCLSCVLAFLYWLFFLKGGDEKRIESILREEEENRQRCRREKEGGKR